MLIMWIKIHCHQRSERGMLKMPYKFKEDKRKYDKRYRQEKKEKIRRWRLKNNIEKSRIRNNSYYYYKNQPRICMKCDKTEANSEIELHHPNYEKQNFVIMLCKECHINLHTGVLI